MAEPYDTLLQVQEHDTALDQLRHRIEAMPERAALAGVRARRADVDVALAEVRARVDDLTARQAALEERIATSARRRHELEERMRSGSVTASKDLQAMDHEVGQLAERERGLEDEELELMEEEEPIDAELAALDPDRRRRSTPTPSDSRPPSPRPRSSSWPPSRTEEAARAELAAGLPADLAERYERLRAHLGGIGAARLVGDHCEGCHLTLPSMEVERIHQLSADTFATCPQCDRILVH